MISIWDDHRTPSYYVLYPLDSSGHHVVTEGDNGKEIIMTPEAWKSLRGEKKLVKAGVRK